ncbi:MAG: type II toxin-antitoxin system HicB family antitoxin [Bryobacterales bacterium]|nr:type II toxin-antitoxin system HicB family antitoxin [Bryobacterales bacterium]
MRYAVVIEAGEHNFSAYVPDLPGCVITGRTRDEIEHNINEAIAFHIEGLREDGAPTRGAREKLSHPRAASSPARRGQT